MNKRLKQCPVCNSQLKIKEYYCENCDTTIKGNFEIGDFALLTPAQQEFAKTFICCSGNIKEVEKQLKISYPTVKNRLAEVQNALCADRMIRKTDSETSNQNIKKSKNSESLLDDLADGKLTVTEVLSKLKGWEEE